MHSTSRLLSLQLIMQRGKRLINLRLECSYISCQDLPSCRLINTSKASTIAAGMLAGSGHGTPPGPILGVHKQLDLGVEDLCLCCAFSRRCVPTPRSIKTISRGTWKRQLFDVLARQGRGYTGTTLRKLLLQNTDGCSSMNVILLADPFKLVQLQHAMQESC